MLTLPLLAALSATPCLEAPAPSDGESLQDLLGRLRKKRDDYLAGLSTQVREILTAMEEQAGQGSAGNLARYRQALQGLGPEAALLYVPAIDPGVAPADAARVRARHVARALREVPTPSVTAELVAMARRSSAQGRRNAIWVLGTSPEPGRASEVLIEIYRAEEGELKEEALASLATLGGSANLAVLTEALAEADPRLVETALTALTAAKNTAVADKVLAVLRDLPRARAHAQHLIAYYRTCPGTVDRHVLDAWIAVASDLDTDDTVRLGALEALPRYADVFGPDQKRDLKELTRSGNRKIAEAALVGCAVLGDSRARKDLLKSYDDGVASAPNWARAWQARGDIYYRIGDDRNAIRNYREALKLGERDTRNDYEDVYIGLARSLARTGKLKNAYEYLRDGPMSISRLRSLAGEEVFAELRAHSRYGEVFHLDGE